MDVGAVKAPTIRRSQPCIEMARLALGLADRGDIANELIAKRIIELAQAGELNPDILCEAVVKELRVPCEVRTTPSSAS